MPVPRSWAAAALALSLPLALAACGSDADDDDSDDSAEDAAAAGCAPEDSHLELVATPEEEHSAGELILDAAPERIVSMSAATTEMLYAVEAGDQVVAVDSESNYPEELPDEEPLDAFNPNVEAVAGHDPDLVVVSHDQDDVISALDEVDIPVYFAPAALTLAESYQQIVDLGSLTGNLDVAEGLIADIDAEIHGMLEELPEREERLTAYYELDAEMFSLTSTTYAGSLLEMACVDNIADEAEDAEETGGYPQLSAEYIVAADPDLIFVSGDDAAAELVERDGWDTVTAVAEDNVVVLDGDVASRWGPRVTELAESIVDAVAAA